VVASQILNKGGIIMPNNRRPPGWFNSDPNWSDTTIAERRQAQNTWDLLAEQEKSNQIAREKLELEKEKFEYMKKKDLKQDDNNTSISNEETLNIDKFKQLHLSNSVGINYSELELFFGLLEHGNIELLDEIQDIKSKIQNSNNEEERYKLEDKIESLELENEKFKEDVYVKFIIFRANHYNKRMEELFKELNFNIVAKNDDEYEFSKEDSQYFDFEDYKVCSDVFNEINEDRGTENDYINFIRKFINSNGKYSETDIKNESLCEELNVDYNSIMQFYNLLLDIKKVAKGKYDEWHDIRIPEFIKEIENNQPLIRANEKIKECYDNGIKILPDILVKYSILYKDELNDIEECPEDIKEIIYKRLNEFAEFRYTHYNESMELLLKEIDLKNMITLDIQKVRANGTTDDYIEYMNNYVRSRKGEV